MVTYLKKEQNLKSEMFRGVKVTFKKNAFGLVIASSAGYPSEPYKNKKGAFHRMKKLILYKQKMHHYPIHDKYNNQSRCPKCGTELKFYDGALGYEALICNKCGYYEDHTSKGQDDSFIGK